MSATPYLHLCWKEYRAIRLFWIAIVLLVLALQWLGPMILYGVGTLVEFNIALAFPALFAVGSAGVAFAGEKEEGTFDFLCAAPIRSGQLLASKLVVVCLATFAMYVALCGSAFAVTWGQVPPTETLYEMVKLWMVGALEAIAWGTLFSLLLDRPLFAVILAIAAGSTIVNIMAWIFAPPPNQMLALGDYSRVLPGRLLVALAVFAADVYLGLRWLQGGPGPKLKPTGAPASHAFGLSAPAEVSPSLAAEYQSRPERSPMLTRLFWHEWRQSKWLMLLMAVLDIGITSVVCYSNTGKELVGAHPGGSFDYQNAVLAPLTIFAALMGSFVFLGDQERRNFRFFVEHNVPPRYVWFTRLLPWILTAAFSTLVVCGIWLAADRNIGHLVRLVLMAFRQERYQDNVGILSLPPLPYALSLAAVSFAAGQWVSMFIRSGILSGFFGLLLCGILCWWVFLMSVLHIPWWWSVAPIPLVLLGATWLRSPDWINENVTWRARLRAGAVVLVPALALCIVMPIYRVQSLPVVQPGFNPKEYLAGITPEALETAKIYQHAGREYVPKHSKEDTDNSTENELEKYDRKVADADRDWLQSNESCLKLLLEASRRPTCALNNPETMQDSGLFSGTFEFFPLLIESGRQLEAEGKLDEALDRYIAALQMVSHWTAFEPAYNYQMLWIERGAAQVLYELPFWAAQAGQTPERIGKAIEMLKAADGSILHVSDGIKSNYILQQRAAHGDESASDILYQNSRGDIFGRILRGKFMPDEQAYQSRLINLISNESLEIVDKVRSSIETHGNVVAYLPQRNRYYGPNNDWYNQREEGWNASWILTEYEAGRRGTMLQLALEAYQLQHRALPSSLNDLVKNYLDALPTDPFSGNEFVYFPQGIPTPPTPFEAKELKESGSGNAWQPAGKNVLVIPEEPCVWCTSAYMLTYNWSENMRTVANNSNVKPEKIVPYYTDRNDGRTLSTYQAWPMGYWFPIPNQQTEPDKSSQK
jgi:hypothetical protein